MTLIMSAFDSPSATFAPIQGVSGNGINIAGASNPQGIPDVLTIENGAMRAYCSDDHATTSGGHRTEIYLTPDTFTAESWIAWDFMLPSSNWVGFTGIITIAQMHDSPDTGDPARQPSFMLQYNNRNLQATWPSAVLPAEVSASRQVPGITLDFDRWYSMCIRILWKTDATGFREVFCDRAPIYREWNVPTSYSDVVAPYFKLGMYFTNNFNPCGNKVLYARNLKRWSGNDGYQTAMGGIVLPRTRITQIF
jgi:hypothetical protein